MFCSSAKVSRDPKFALFVGEARWHFRWSGPIKGKFRRPLSNDRYKLSPRPLESKDFWRTWRATKRIVWESQRLSWRLKLRKFDEPVEVGDFCYQALFLYVFNGSRDWTTINIGWMFSARSSLPNNGRKANSNIGLKTDSQSNNNKMPEVWALVGLSQSWQKDQQLWGSRVCPWSFYPLISFVLTLMEDEHHQPARCNSLNDSHFAKIFLP